MGTIAEKLIYVNGTKSAIKTAIEAKGVTVGNATFREYATKIGEITTSSGETSGWQPDPLWTNIRDLYDNDPLAASYTYRAVYLIAAADATTVFKSKSRYITSDGYDSGTELSSDYTHTWDTTKDIIDSKSAYTRWIKVYDSSAVTYPHSFNSKLLWVIYNLSATIIGNASPNNTDYMSRSHGLQKVEMLNKVTSIGDRAFMSDYTLQSAVIPSNITDIGVYAFYECGLTAINIPHGVTTLGDWCFAYCRNAVTAYIPNTITSLGIEVFTNCEGLRLVVLESGFNCNGLKLANTTLLSRQVLVAILTALADRTGLSAYTIRLASANKAKLSAADLRIATDNNWTVA